MQQRLEFCLEVVVVGELVDHLTVVVAEQQHDAFHPGLELLHVAVAPVHDGVTDGVLLLQARQQPIKMPLSDNVVSSDHGHSQSKW